MILLYSEAEKYEQEIKKYERLTLTQSLLYQGNMNMEADIILM